MGDGQDQQGRGEGGVPEQHLAVEAPAGEITAQLKKATTQTNDATIKKELDWQARVGEDATKAMAFCDQALSQQTFRAFTFMKGKLPAVHMAHSVGAFFSMSGLATNVQGKQIVFVGDRGNVRQPIPFILPPQNSWTWARIRYLSDTARFGEYYRQVDNQDKLWKIGAPDNELTKQQLPRLLALPTFVAKFLVQQRGACLPHNLRMFIKTHINGGDSQVPGEKWQLILNWCLAASQGGNNGSSLLNLGSPESALCQDDKFLEWCNLRLSTTLGREQQQRGPQGNGGGDRTTSNSLNGSPLTWAKVSWRGSKHWPQPSRGPQNRGERTTGTAEVTGWGAECTQKIMSPHSRAIVVSWIPPTSPPWDSFQQTRDIASHWHNLRVSMTKWAKQTGKEINKAPFFIEQTIKDIVSLNFNPGKGVPTYSSTERGISILTCRPKMAHKVETIKDNEEAWHITAHTALFHEVRRHQKTPQVLHRTPILNSV
jgi:hypothetical protein